MNRLAPALGLLLSAALASAASGADIVLLRDGTRRVGSLQACTAVECRLDGKAIARLAIYRIGLATDETAGPAPADPARDEVRLRDGTLHAGRIAGVSLGAVATEQGSYDRADVAWLYFAVPAEREPETEDSPTLTGQPVPPDPADSPAPDTATPPPPPPPPPDQTTDPPPGVEPPPDRPPPPRPPRAPDDEARECPPGKPLGGEVEIRLHGIQEQQFEWRSVARFWFPLVPQPGSRLKGRRWVAQTFVGSELTWDLRAQACVDLPGSAGFATEVCSCPAATASGRVLLSAGDEVQYSPMRPELGLRMPDEIRYSIEQPLRCTDRTAESHTQVGWHLDSRYDISPDCSHLCVAPTACTSGANDPCVAHPERYAVLPFEGKARIGGVVGGGGLVEEVVWRVCCGCGERFKGPPPPMDRDPCGDLEQYQAQVDRAAAEAQALRNQLKSLFESYTQHWQQAQTYSSDYELFIRSCGRWETAMTLMEYLAGGPKSPKAAQAFVAWIGIMEKALAGDPSVILAILGQTFEGVDAAEGVLELGGALGDMTYEDLWDLISDARSTMLDVSQAGSIESIRQRMEDCAGTPMVSDLVYQDALKFVAEMAALFDLQPQIDSLATQIGQADARHWKWQWDYYNACLQWAACKEIDPKVCGSPPAAPR